VPHNPEANIIWLASACMAPCNATPKVSGLFFTVFSRTIGWYSPQQNLQINSWESSRSTAPCQARVCGWRTRVCQVPTSSSFSCCACVYSARARKVSTWCTNLPSIQFKNASRFQSGGKVSGVGCKLAILAKAPSFKANSNWRLDRRSSQLFIRQQTV
jgi:hypothetical protein